MMKVSSEGLAYLAGLFDGEGSFSILMNIRRGSNRPSVYFNPRMTMSIYYGREVLDLLVSAFGGAVYTGKNGREFRWVLGQRVQLVAAATQLLPFLRIKRAICARFLEALSWFPTSRNNHLKGERSWSQQAVVVVGEIALTLNPHASRKSTKTTEFIDRLKEQYNAPRPEVASYS